MSADIPYFQRLNYTLGNEDTTLEWEMVRKLNPKRVLAVCGSGGRSLPLLMPNTDKLVLADLAGPQLGLARLRLATYRDLSFDQFLRFWGYAPYADENLAKERQELFNKLQLSDSDKQEVGQALAQAEWGALLYRGGWEKTFATLSRIVRLFFGKHVERLFGFRDLKSQQSYMRNGFPHRRWGAIIALLGNRQVFNALLYKGDFIKKNVPESYVRYYREAYERLFAQGPARQSFFLNLCFFGKLAFIEGNPLEARPEVHAQLHKALAQGDRVDFEHKDIFKAQGGPFDFISISDVPSYFGGELEKNFLQLLLPLMNPGAHIVVRYYLRVCLADVSGFEDVTGEYIDLIDSERVQMYRVKIYKKI